MPYFKIRQVKEGEINKKGEGIGGALHLECTVEREKPFHYERFKMCLKQSGGGW